MFCINMLVLTKFTKERTWKFRLVVIPSVILGTIVLALIIYLVFTLSGSKHTEVITTNITQISPKG